VVGLGRNLSYGSLTEEGRALRQNCFGPWARRIESQLSRALLSDIQRRELILEHDLSGLERAALKERLGRRGAAAITTTMIANVMNGHQLVIPVADAGPLGGSITPFPITSTIASIDAA
jgi:hypothetical protein